MNLEYPCQWPMSIDVLRVRPSNLKGMDVALTMTMGRGVVSSVHLKADTAADLCQDIVAVAYPGEVVQASWPCRFSGGHPSNRMLLDIEEDGMVAVRVQGGLCYLSKEDARAAAIHLLRMCGDGEG